MKYIVKTSLLVVALLTAPTITQAAQHHAEDVGAQHTTTRLRTPQHIHEFMDVIRTKAAQGPARKVLNAWLVQNGYTDNQNLLSGGKWTVGFKGLRTGRMTLDDVLASFDLPSVAGAAHGGAFGGNPGARRQAREDVERQHREREARDRREREQARQQAEAEEEARRRQAQEDADLKEALRRSREDAERQRHDEREEAQRRQAQEDADLKEALRRSREDTEHQRRAREQAEAEEDQPQGGAQQAQQNVRVGPGGVNEYLGQLISSRQGNVLLFKLNEPQMIGDSRIEYVVVHSDRAADMPESQDMIYLRSIKSRIRPVMEMLTSVAGIPTHDEVVGPLNMPDKDKTQTQRLFPNLPSVLEATFQDIYSDDPLTINIGLAASLGASN